MLQKGAAKSRFGRLIAVENELKKQAPAPFPLSRALRTLPERSPLYMILQKSGLFEQFLLQIRSGAKPVFLILHCIILDNGFSILQSTRCFYNSGKSLHICFIIEPPVYHQFHTRIIAKMLQKRRPIPLRQPTPCIMDAIRSCKFFYLTAHIHTYSTSENSRKNRYIRYTVPRTYSKSLQNRPLFHHSVTFYTCSDFSKNRYKSSCM